LKASGVDFVKVYWMLPRKAYFAIADESKKQNIPFAGHVPFSISAFEASDAGQRSIEHLTEILFTCSAREKEFRKLDQKNWGVNMMGKYWILTMKRNAKNYFRIS